MMYNYEEALNAFLLRYSNQLYYEWISLDFATNILHMNNSLSSSEKEKKIASLTGVGFNYVREEIQNIAQEIGVTYSKALDICLNSIEIEQMDDEEFYNNSVVLLTLPSGISEPLSYGTLRITYQSAVPSQNRKNMFGVVEENVQNSGRYTYTAENYKGTKAEVTVPVELITANFKVKVSDTETNTYEFIEGQSWGQFIGEEEDKEMSDNYYFHIGFYGIEYYVELAMNEKKQNYKIASLNMQKLRIAAAEAEHYAICTRNGTELTRNIITDKIIANRVYELGKQTTKVILQPSD